MKTTIFDVETDGFLDVSTKVHCLCTVDLDTGEQNRFTLDGAFGYRPLEEGLALLERSDRLVGHNIQHFDVPVLLKHYPDFKPPSDIFDTELIAPVVWPDIRPLDIAAGVPPKLIGKHKLEAWGHRLGIHKGDYGIDRDDWSVMDEEMVSYCMQDAVVNLKLYQRILEHGVDPRAVELEHRFAEIMRFQERTGFLLDVKGAERLYAELTDRRLVLQEELKELFPPRLVKWTTPKLGLEREKLVEFNPNSRQQIAANLKEKYGWTPARDGYTPSGQVKIDEAVLAKLPYPGAKKLVDLLILTKRLGQIHDGKNGWLKLVGEDNRLHGVVRPMGTPTSRCSHFRPNLAQVPAGKKLYGRECRELFIVRPGFGLVGNDAKGAQLRCLGHYLFPFDGGVYSAIVSEGDPHDRHRAALGFPEGDSWRDVAKTWIYAFLFGAGNKKLGAVAGGDEQLGQRLKEMFYANLDGIAELNSAIEDRLVSACGFTKTKGRGRTFLRAPKRPIGGLRGLDGRRLMISSSHKALNYLLQSAEAIIMKKATVILQDLLEERGIVRGRDYFNVAHIHDEFQLEVRLDLCEQVGELAAEAIRLAGVFYDFRCPLAGEYKVGRNWAETH